MLRLSLLVGLSLLAFLPGSAAQATPDVDLAIDLPPGPVEIELGDSHDVPFEVSLTLRGVVCTSASQVRIPLSVKDKPSPLDGVRATPTPAEVVFDVPAGQYTSNAFSKSVESVLAVSVAASAPAAHEHSFEVLAAFAGGVPSGCQGTGTAPAAEARAAHAIVTGGGAGASSSGTHQMEDGTTMEGEAMSEPSKDTPGPGVFAALLALLAGFALRRR
jgi:MYXO-CTERM domain-containing protein